MDDTTEKLGQKIDTLINLLYAMDLPMPATIHVSALKESLPDLARDLINIHSELGGENIWEDEIKLKNK